jgi:hypothetical protein
MTSWYAPLHHDDGGDEVHDLAWRAPRGPSGLATSSTLRASARGEDREAPRKKVSCVPSSNMHAYPQHVNIATRRNVTSVWRWQSRRRTRPRPQRNDLSHHRFTTAHDAIQRFASPIPVRARPETLLRAADAWVLTTRSAVAHPRCTCTHDAKRRCAPPMHVHSRREAPLRTPDARALRTRSTVASREWTCAHDAKHRSER